MSEITFPFRKAIPIIVVTWILSSVTTLAIVYFTSNISPKTWHEMVRFEGYDTDDYWNSFEVPSMHWRIYTSVDPFNWTISASYKDARFHLIVDDFTLRELTGSDTLGYMNYHYFTGSGRHWIELYARSVEWFIIVEAYY